jgi:hypothetical protein
MVFSQLVDKSVKNLGNLIAPSQPDVASDTAGESKRAKGCKANSHPVGNLFPTVGRLAISFPFGIGHGDSNADATQGSTTNRMNITAG